MRRHKISENWEKWLISNECKITSERFEIDDSFLDLEKVRGCLSVVFNLLLYMAFAIVFVGLKSLMTETGYNPIRAEEFLSLGVAFVVIIVICITLAMFRVAKLHLVLHTIC